MSVVGFSLRLAGDVSSFTSSVLDQMKSAIAARAGVGPSAVELTVRAGSVIVGVSILTPLTTSASVQSAMASATSNSSSATAMLESVTGISVNVLTVVTSPTVTVVVSSPPAPAPSGSLFVALSVENQLIIAIAVGAGGFAVIAIVCCCFCYKCLRPRKPTTGASTMGIPDPFPRAMSAPDRVATVPVVVAVPAVRHGFSGAQQGQAARPTTRERASADFDQLVAMGFDPSKVAAALSQNRGDREKALNMLLSGASRISWSSADERGFEMDGGRVGHV